MSSSSAAAPLLEWHRPTVAPHSLRTLAQVREALQGRVAPALARPGASWPATAETAQIQRWMDVRGGLMEVSAIDADDLFDCMADEALVISGATWRALVDQQARFVSVLREHPRWQTSEVVEAERAFQREIITAWRQRDITAPPPGYHEVGQLTEVVMSPRIGWDELARLVYLPPTAPPLPMHTLVRIGQHPGLEPEMAEALIHAIGPAHPMDPSARAHAVRTFLQFTSWHGWASRPRVVEALLDLAATCPEAWWGLLRYHAQWPTPLRAAWAQQPAEVCAAFPGIAELELRALAPEDWRIVPPAIQRWALLQPSRDLRTRAIGALGQSRPDGPPPDAAARAELSGR